jgi:hypothetical protein
MNITADQNIEHVRPPTMDSTVSLPGYHRSLARFTNSAVPYYLRNRSILEICIEHLSTFSAA